jgi:hypothetical protein
MEACMYRRGVLATVLLAGASLVFARPAGAQVVTPASTTASKFSTTSELKAPTVGQSTRPMEFFIEYNLMHYSEESSHFGLGFGGLFPLGNPRLGVVGGLNFNRFGYEGGSTTNTTVYAGMAYLVPSESKYKPFVQGVVGVDNWGDSVFMIEPGGGVSFPLTDKINFHATAGLHIGFWDGDASAGFRAGFGVSMPFGSK